MTDFENEELKRVNKKPREEEQSTKNITHFVLQQPYRILKITYKDQAQNNEIKTLRLSIADHNKIESIILKDPLTKL